eukprot:5389126-Prymnesium_polylepis.1
MRMHPCHTRLPAPRRIYHRYRIAINWPSDSHRIAIGDQRAIRERSESGEIAIGCQADSSVIAITGSDPGSYHARGAPDLGGGCGGAAGRARRVGGDAHGRERVVAHALQPRGGLLLLEARLLALRGAQLLALLQLLGA